uniref:Protein kinase domain-containing protein n=1 Tax=Panagrolaimus davidi TaxID=227884 RepID=A0A914R5S8_9BILA
MPRHNSSAEELIRKESEATENEFSEKNEIKREYLYIAGSIPKYSQLIIITNKNEFSIAQECNAGYFSKVHKGKFRNKDVAIKIAEDNGRKSIHTELKIYDKICHSNILPALAVYFGVKNMLFMPFRNYNLSQYFISNGINITVEQLLKYSIQISDAMTYLHSMKILHCDLKIDNILMKDSSGKNVEISDFGCAVDLIDQVSPCFNGTTTHAAYELLKSYILFENNKALAKNCKVFCSKKSDVWSFAITIWQIFQKSSKIPENFQSPTDIVKNYENGNPLPKPKLMPDYIWRYIILRCFDLDPKVRPYMSEIYESLNLYQQKYST